MSGPDGSPRSEQNNEHVADAANEPLTKPHARKRRRVSTEPPQGSDPHPTGEPERYLVDENDERLKGDKPPHWG